MQKMLKVVPIAFILMAMAMVVPIVLAAPAFPANAPQNVTGFSGAILLRSSAVQTSTTPVTRTGVLTETRALTQTEAVTGTNAMTETGTVTSTAAMTETGALTRTAVLTRTGAITSGNSTAASCTEDYTVQAGDTLGGIASTLLGSTSAYTDIVEATNQAGRGYATITDPNLIMVGDVLCIPGTIVASPTPAPTTPTTTVQVSPTITSETGTAAQNIMADVPPGKSKFIFENLTAVDIVFDLSGPTIASMVIPPGAKQEFIIEPGTYTYNAHQPGGDLTLAPGNFDIAPGKATGVSCFDNGQCTPQQVVAPQAQQPATTPAAAASSNTNTGTNNNTSQRTSQGLATTSGSQQGTTTAP